MISISFDPETLELAGHPMTIVNDVAQQPYGIAAFSASATSTLVLQGTELVLLMIGTDMFSFGRGEEQTRVTGGGHWFKVKLIGTQSNRNAIGARGTAHMAERSRHRKS